MNPVHSLNPHSHDNNPTPPDDDTTIHLHDPAGNQISIPLDRLHTDYAQSVIPAYTYTTDHGRHGPYRLEGVRLLDLINQNLNLPWNQVEVISADGFGNHLLRSELASDGEEPVLLCTRSNGEPLTRQHGLVRLVVPSETDNALRQIKWVRKIVVK